MKPRKPESKTDNRNRSQQFEESSDENRFETLMKNLGVSPITKTVDKQDRKEVINPAPDKTVFEKDSNGKWQSATVSLERKFSGGQNQIAARKKNRKQKITRNFQPDSQIDLHGETRDGALHKVNYFIEHSIRQKCKTALIITGRGVNSEIKGGILRKTVWNWLEEQQKEKNFSFRWAPNFLGGKGAILVFL